MSANNLVDVPAFQQGEIQPLAVYVEPSDAASRPVHPSVASATYALYQLGGSGSPVAQGSCTVVNDNVGAILTTPLQTFSTAGAFVCWFDIAWSDSFVTKGTGLRFSVYERQTA